MAIDTSTYGTVSDANIYFSSKLHEFAWSHAPSADRPKALLAATRVINTLNFKGVKAAVQTVLDNNPVTTPDQLNALQDILFAANASQPLEFPRGNDTEVPDDIILATYEIAYALVDGRDPDLELENLGLTSAGIASLRSTYNREQVPIEHLINGVVSATAWRFLRPYLRDDNGVSLDRVN